MSAISINDAGRLTALLKELALPQEQIESVVYSATQDSQWLARHIAELDKILAALKGEAGAKAIRVLLSDSSQKLRLAPPYMVGQLKSALADFNAKTFTWRKLS